MRVSYDELHAAVVRALGNVGLEADRADLCARIVADSSRDGVASHGLNLLPRVLRMFRSGTIDVHGRPICVEARGSLERWDGQHGVGALNAHECMERVIRLARAHGIGCVALRNTNHWMRGGTYGWQAAEAGVIGLCWTNTMPNLPPWGASEPRIGNNPLVIAVPRAAGHVVLDMAMSQFSFGALAAYRMRGDLLPVAGGFDPAGELTRDAAAIEASGRALPIGFWKGSGLALMLDVIASALSGGRATHQVPPRSEEETGLSQVFIAIQIDDRTSHIADAIVEHVGVRYPGERALQARRENTKNGIPVEPSAWDLVRNS
jgi:3-dehydro-L-gulonate 2-dehydrogenase